MTYLMAIGTKKGLFTASSRDRRDWDIQGPVGPDGDSTGPSGVYAVGIDRRRATPRILAGGDSAHYGPSVWHSDDLGKSWTEPQEAPIRFGANDGASLERAWQFSFGPGPDTVYAGVEPHALFRSDDGGLTFGLNRALWDHPHRSEWFPGAGGAAIHTVLPHPDDPESLLVAMSTGGVYASNNGGRSWVPRNNGIEADFMPDRFPTFGQCVHKVARAGSNRERLYAQNHGGVYRSDDEGATWVSIADGLPSDFGFAIVAHPSRDDTVFSFPVSSAMERFPTQHRLQVYRSDDAGRSWHAMNDGLSSGPYFGIVLRDAACTDDEDTDPGFYFGTRCGDVYAARDSDGQWHQVVGHLPDVLCVRVARV
ncbi:MAG TPA: glycoside hydrolase [Candidatus Stackebrandtia faecavium]|nr:glycoside hydrolase [Candidatus Stackebrandtia faecavium]